MKYLALPFFVLLFSSCASKYKLQEEPPAGIKEVYLQKTVGGREESHVEYKIHVRVDKSDIELDKVYFRNQKTSLSKENPQTWSAMFLVVMKPMDMIMSSNPLDEYGNSIERKTPDYPFDLKKDEAVISYKEGSKTRFFKIKNIKEKPTEYLPGRNPENK